jgi:hypothetical protein
MKNGVNLPVLLVRIARTKFQKTLTTRDLTDRGGVSLSSIDQEASR